MRHMNAKLLTPKEAAEWLSVTPRTVARWCREGKLPATKMGRLWRIPQVGLADPDMGQRVVNLMEKRYTG